jgi:shikimate kinase
MSNLFIIGPYGAGKSSIGYQISKLLKRPFFDTDREIEKKAGVDIDWMFTIEGEAGFRVRELQIVKELSAQKNAVIATGGGTITIPECRQLLQEHTIIYLQVPFEEQLSRVKRFPAKRPTLDKQDPQKKLEKLNHEREVLYQNLADYTYTNTGKFPKKLAQTICEDLKSDHLIGDS